MESPLFGYLVGFETFFSSDKLSRVKMVNVWNEKIRGEKNPRIVLSPPFVELVFPYCADVSMISENLRSLIIALHTFANKGRSIAHGLVLAPLILLQLLLAALQHKAPLS